jgi:ribonuclease PH
MAKIMRREPRQIRFTTGVNPYAHGSVIVEFGNTKVHVTATVEESVPPFLKGKGQGWVTAEYSMLPSATHTRNQRERTKISGRTQEIQRLIGRSMRAIVDLKKLGERTLMIDCDVLIADGGTRTASISAAYVAIVLAVKKLENDGKLKASPLINQLAAISVGVNKAGDVIADLNYEEDSSCETDMNVVMTREGQFVEIQGTAEGSPFSSDQLTLLLEAAKDALSVIFKQQDKALA